MKREIIENVHIKDKNGHIRNVVNRKKLEFNPDGKSGIIRITVSKEYELETMDRVVIELPTSCCDCPCGFGNPEDSCGRNIPFTNVDSKERPSTCRLRTLEQYIQEVEQERKVENGE